MLLRNAHAAHGLNAPGNGGCHFTGHEGIFRVVFKVPSAQRIAVDIEPRCQPDGYADLQHFLAYSIADLFQQFRVPCLRLYSLAGPSGHVPISCYTFSRQMLNDRLHLFEPAPFPIRRQPLRVLGRSPCGCGRNRDYVESGGAV